MEASRIMAESQTVIGLRLAGMAGFWPMGQAETGRMVMEKLEAGALAAGAAFQAGMAGGNASEIAMAAMKPVRRRTRANARRLSRKAGGKA
jgi:hypothetical protein